jgi:hypothetical protein
VISTTRSSAYWRVVGKALFDLIQKTVASPFSMFGSLAKFDSEELQPVEFVAGSAEIDDVQGKARKPSGRHRANGRRCVSK